MRTLSGPTLLEIKEMKTFYRAEVRRLKREAA